MAVRSLKPKPKPISKWMVAAAAVLVLGAIAYRTFSAGALAPKTIVLIGLDEGKFRADVVAVAHVEPRTGMVSLISIPRDTLVTIPCKGLTYCVTPDKLAHAHVYGGDRGPEVTKQAVEELLGVPVDHFVRIDYEGFRGVVDILGGVDMVIDKNMDYEDPYAHPPLKIHFKASPKPQHLDGTQALNYVRFRADGLGDIGRIERTKRFFTALAETARKNGTITKLPSLVSSMWPFVYTDLDAPTAVALARLAPKVDPSHIRLEMVPGQDEVLQDGRWVWNADPVKTPALVDRLIKNLKPAEADGAK